MTRRGLEASVGDGHWIYAYGLSPHADLLSAQQRLDEAEETVERA